MTKAAKFVSNAFDPIPTTALIGLVGIFATPMSQASRLLWLGFVGGLGLIVALALVWFVRKGYVFDARLTHGDDLHRDRLGILWVANGLLAFAVVVATQLGRPEPLWTILLAMTVVLVIATFITTRYKVSLHMVGVTSFVTILLLHFGLQAAAALLLLPLVAWSRRALHRHTSWQLLTGTVVAATTIIIIFQMTGQFSIR